MGIMTMEQFNERVEEVMAMHNERFGTDPGEMENAFVSLEMSEEELDRMLTKRRKRKADKGSCFSIDNKRVQLAKDDGTILAVKPGTIVEFRTSWTGEIFGYHNHEYYLIKDAGLHVVSPLSEQSHQGPVPASKKQHKPSSEHPWRHT